MALTAYLRVVGTRQGEIKGSVTQKGREGRIAVIAVSHELLSPRDAATGQATGKRQHKPFVITKELGALDSRLGSDAMAHIVDLSDVVRTQFGGLAVIHQPGDPTNDN